MSLVLLSHCPCTDLTPISYPRGYSLLYQDTILYCTIYSSPSYQTTPLGSAPFDHVLLNEVPIEKFIAQHPKASPHASSNQLPGTLRRSRRAVEPYDIFKLFSIKSLLQLLVANTNAYVAYKEAGVTERRWENVTEKRSIALL